MEEWSTERLLTEVIESIAPEWEDQKKALEIIHDRILNPDPQYPASQEDLDRAQTVLVLPRIYSLTTDGDLLQLYQGAEDYYTVDLKDMLPADQRQDYEEIKECAQIVNRTFATDPLLERLVDGEENKDIRKWSLLLLHELNVNNADIMQRLRDIAAVPAEGTSLRAFAIKVLGLNKHIEAVWLLSAFLAVDSTELVWQVRLETALALGHIAATGKLSPAQLERALSVLFFTEANEWEIPVVKEAATQAIEKVLDWSCDAKMLEEIFLYAEVQK